jgi:hypothetical protein
METNTSTKMITKTSHLLKYTIAVAIVIVVNLFFHYVIATFYVEPKFETYCPMQTQNLASPEACVNAGGQWTNNQLAPQEITVAIKNGTPLGWCDPNFTCNKNYTEAHSVYNRNVFIVLIILSLAVLTLGTFLLVEVLSLGFSWAGVVSLIIASGQYWSDANNWMRLVILALALAMLVWLAIKKFRE